MSTKIKNTNAKKPKKNPNTGLYIAIAVMAVIIVAIVAFFIYDAVSDKSSDISEPITQQQGNVSEPQVKATAENFLEIIDRTDAKKVQFTMNDGQTFTMELYPKVAPITVENFLKLVDEGFYSGLTFHRVIEGFMAQGGAYDPINQANNPAESIVGEFSSNGYENNLSHQRGVVSMARTMDPNSASSQFFICYDDVSSSLDGEYAAFGYVTEGMETVDSFLSEGTDANDVPNKEVVIKEAKIVE